MTTYTPRSINQEIWLALHLLRMSLPAYSHPSSPFDLAATEGSAVDEHIVDLKPPFLIPRVHSRTAHPNTSSTIVRSASCANRAGPDRCTRCSLYNNCLRVSRTPHC